MLTATTLTGRALCGLSGTGLADIGWYEEPILMWWNFLGRSPSLTAWELRAGRYVELRQVTGDEEFAASTHFTVTIQPSALRD